MTPSRSGSAMPIATTASTPAIRSAIVAAAPVLDRWPGETPCRSRKSRAGWRAAPRSPPAANDRGRVRAGRRDVRELEDARGTAVDHEKERIALPRRVPDGKRQESLDRLAAVARPRDHSRLAERMLRAGRRSRPRCGRERSGESGLAQASVGSVGVCRTKPIQVPRALTFAPLTTFPRRSAPGSRRSRRPARRGGPRRPLASVK